MDSLADGLQSYVDDYYQKQGELLAEELRPYEQKAQFVTDEYKCLELVFFHKHTFKFPSWPGPSEDRRSGRWIGMDEEKVYFFETYDRVDPVLPPEVANFRDEYKDLWGVVVETDRTLELNQIIQRMIKLNEAYTK